MIYTKVSSIVLDLSGIFKVTFSNGSQIFTQRNDLKVDDSVRIHYVMGMPVIRKTMKVV